ncbi:MAG: hypothetical protein ACP5G6_08310, partial [Conexivisphaera sp.]
PPDTAHIRPISSGWILVAFERILSWLSGYKFFHNCVLTNSDMERAPLEWNPPPWLEGVGLASALSWIVSLG